MLYKTDVTNPNFYSIFLFLIGLSMQLDGSKQTIKLSKYSSLENDFLIIDRLKPKFFSKKKAQKLCDRSNIFGGADGIIHIVRTKDPEHFNMLVQNADGSNGEFSGNGLRCMAAYLFDTGYRQDGFLLDRNEKKSVARCYKKKEKIVSIFTIERINPILYIIPISEKKTYSAYTFNIPNPHCLLSNSYDTYQKIANNAEELLKEYSIISETIQNHNISWCTEKDSFLYIRTHERGVGFTAACSSALLAILTFLYYQNKHINPQGIEKKIVIMPGGTCSAQINYLLKTIEIAAEVTKVKDFELHIK